ncbi:iron-sulfur cluster assembly scaffold protein [Candidatus Woesearchaeota archaeon]|nr:iron-sulfur cluster assembly scaffold protein [Candidatus Woesearchaeota archaeon]
MAYSEKVKQRFMHPTHRGTVKDADSHVTVQSEICGDEIEISFNVKEGKISKCMFESLGCAISVATCDVICELAEGKTINEAEKLTKQDIITGVGDLPTVKIHCGDLSAKGLREAIKQYKAKHM